MYKKIRNTSILSILWLSLFVSLTVYAQDLSYFVLGKSELENADIYSILQTKNKKLFVSTNKGLYEYKHGEMTSVSNAKNQKGVSVFGLISNSENEVFCYNLSGQIFKIKNQKLHFYNQVPEKYLGSYISMVFDESDNLVVASRGCYVIQDSKIIELYYSKDTRSVAISKLIDNRVVLITNSGITMILNNGEFQYIKTLPSYGTPYRGKALLLNDSITIPYKLENQLKKEKFTHEYIQVSKNEIWRRASSIGIDVLEIEENNINIKQSYFKNTFISKIAIGENGLLFLGTFGNGLYVIPNKKSKTYFLGEYGENMGGIAVDDEENVFITDRTDGIIHFKEKASLLDNSLNFVPEKIFINETKEVFVNKKYPSIFYNNMSIGGSVKDIYTVDNTTVLLATSRGLMKIGNSTVLNEKDWDLISNKPNEYYYYYKKFEERCVSVVFDSENTTVYVASISGLWQLKDNRFKEEILFDGKPLTVNDLVLHKGILWCATQNLGILGYQNGKFTHQMSVGNETESHFINKIEEKNDSLYVSHKDGFKILDLNTLKTETLGTAEGVIDGSARDFAIGKDKLWYISNNQLFSTSTTSGVLKKPNFNLNLDSLVVANKRVNIDEKTVFNHKENQLQCYVHFSGIPYEKESILKYKLKGFEEEWNSIDIHTNLIEYKFLPSGDYQLEVIAVYRDFVSKPISYSFKIQRAFWLNWWFVLGAIIFSLGAISALFLYRLRRTKTKNKKQLEDQVLKANLIETELKALRSQMNPHFIFNSLNSIQDLILQQDTNGSYDYIVLFSDLVRNTLNFSNKNFIPLEREIEFLETYLKLEKLRFDDHFKYIIEADNLDDISIPSLILQPFVENAIIHGLFHKSGSKNLSIIFKRRNNYIYCSITDNGIGRKKAQSILKRQGKSHISFALDSIQKRLDILKNKYGNEVGYTITDLGTSTESEGTRVDIILPFLD